MNEGNCPKYIFKKTEIIYEELARDAPILLKRKIRKWPPVIAIIIFYHQLIIHISVIWFE